jgi:hypothetical protein
MDEQMTQRFAEKIGTRYSPHEETTAQLDIKAARWIAPSQQQQQQGRRAASGRCSIGSI